MQIRIMQFFICSFWLEIIDVFIVCSLGCLPVCESNHIFLGMKNHDTWTPCITNIIKSQAKIYQAEHAFRTDHWYQWSLVEMVLSRSALIVPNRFPPAFRVWSRQFCTGRNMPYFRAMTYGTIDKDIAHDGMRQHPSLKFWRQFLCSMSTGQSCTRSAAAGLYASSAQYNWVPTIYATTPSAHGRISSYG